MDNYSFLGTVPGAYIEAIYEQYLKDPDGVEPTWRSFFQGFDFAKEVYSEDGQEEVPDSVRKEFLVINLIEAYRTRGHLFTETNPVRARRKYRPTLDIENFGLNSADLDTVFQAGTQIGLGPTTLREIVAHLEQVYCKSIGVEYMYIRQPEEVKWIQQKLQENYNTPTYTPEQKKHILHKLNEAVAFESFLHTKFVGQKRFSLEGAEALIPALDAAIEKAAQLGVEEFVMGMAHRGRLNVLANIFGKTYKDIFSEFESKDFEDALFDGDVKYHLGYTSTKKRKEGSIRISLAPNPSHLESVDPVVEGIARAKINNVYGGDNRKLLPILIHGDAAIASQGVVYEVVQMAQLDGYKTGGTVHIVVNNQIGFTTNYTDGRSSTYCADVGKVTLSPVMHVNADDVEAVVHCVQFAIQYRQQFHKDVFIDLKGYRKYGHNEGDEPRFTQPLLYKLIARHANPRQIYNEKLMQEGIVGDGILKEMDREFREMLENRFDESKKIEKNYITPFMEEEWKDYRRAKHEDFEQAFDTSFNTEQLKHITKTITTIPEGKKLFKKTQRLLEERRKMVEESNRIDWGMAELLAYGSLLTEGFNVRVSGQDVERGTFSHRHAILKVEDSEEELCLLNHIDEEQGRMAIYNSPLSEYGVMGFDYGYAMATPETLVIWEAQFGDFSNGAQIIIDQYLSSAEDKWKTHNGLVLLLPHGYEGQGAEHSSARMERYLQLCAQDNMQMVNASTPANFFHLLRRQMKRDFRKPLVVFTPKSLLRHPKAVSGLEELAQGHFSTLIDDPEADAETVTRLAFCSGKVYYELIEEREKLGVKNIAFVRLEQLYPLPYEAIQEVLSKYKNAEKYLWVQEEPANMGAWTHILVHLPDIQWELASQKASAAPATGSSARAAKRQREIIETVFKQ